MRLVNSRRLSAGFTLIELMVVVTVMAILMLKGAPALASYVTNSRIRETANIAVTTAVLARNEAIKRNTTVSVASDGSSLVVSVGGTALQTVPLSGARVAAFTRSFDSLGRLSPFPGAAELQAQVDGGPNVLCSDDIVCPVLRIETGGIVSLCRTGSCS